MFTSVSASTSFQGVNFIDLNNGAFDSILNKVSLDVQIILLSASKSSAFKLFSQFGISVISISKFQLQSLIHSKVLSSFKVNFIL